MWTGGRRTWGWAARRESFLLLCFLFFALAVTLSHSRKTKSSHNKVTAAEVDLPAPSSPAKKAWSTAHASATSPTSGKSQKGKTSDGNGGIAGEFSIEDVDEDKIDEILRDGTKNLVVFFYDGRVRCPSCGEALSEVEEIDDDIEGTGYIEVVKTDDRRVARDCGVSTFPALVYFRRQHPILYDGDFKDSEVIWRWLRSHEEVVTWELTDDNFESRTDSHSPDEGALDWLVMFFDSEDPECNAFAATLETVAHKLRGLVHVGRVDTSVADDVAERFRIDTDNSGQCPTFLLFHRGKLFRHSDPAKDVKTLTSFALNRYKDQRGHRVPDPPTALEHFYEHIKEKVVDMLDDQQTLTIVGVGGLIGLVTLLLAWKAYKIKQQQQQQNYQSQPEKKAN